MSSSHETVVVGAGLAGLACALALTDAGRDAIVLEAAPRVGGRVATDRCAGPGGDYLIDRGFQVLLTAYPEARRTLDYARLDLRTFYAGALVRLEGRSHRVANPWKHPIDAARAFGSPVATLADKTRLAELYAVNRLTSIDTLLAKPEVQTITMLRYLGFDDRTIDRFFRPFFGGVFFDRDLATSSRMFEFVFRMFATGETAVPATGMARIPEQMASRLPEGTVRLGTRVDRIEPAHDGVVVHTGAGPLRAARVVIATGSTDAARLLGDDAADLNDAWVGTSTLAYACLDADTPTREPILILDGDGRGPVNHLAVMSSVAPAYAPAGHGLIYANTVGVPPVDDAALDAAARAQMRSWFGDRVDRWTLLRIVRIPCALPDQRVTSDAERVSAGLRGPRGAAVRPGVYLCGDHRTNASIDGAMRSGRLTAETILAGR
jgi:phytoene dehydrogenase-like protein